MRVDDALLGHLDAIAGLAPLHDARAIATMRTLEAIRPDLPVVACFDTAFHVSIPDAAATYAVPWSWTTDLGLRKLGFHGLSHAYASRRAAELLDRPLESLRTVTAHLGSGASLAAVLGGVSVDTTMGFTPIDGLVMSTRSGSVDPGVVAPGDASPRPDPRRGRSAARAPLRSPGALRCLGRHAGSGRGRGPGDPRARLAVDVTVHRLRAGIAAMAAAMAGLDALVFTGGVGEHSPRIRRDACADLAFLGIELDDTRNSDPPAGDLDLAVPAAGVRVLRISAREDVEIARQVREVLASG